jgi:NADH-quinone oxidoreductase subunit F
MGTDFTLASLKNDGYEAFFLGVGAPESLPIGIVGEDAEGVVQAGDFLRTYNIRGSVPVGKKVIVVGGGNAAVDASRSALRLGAEEITILYRRSQGEMPAYAEEIDEAIHEGVKLLPLTHPMEIVKDASGKVCGVRCTSMKLGEFDRSGRRRPEEKAEFFTLEADQVIVAIGQSLRPKNIIGDLELKLNSRNFIEADYLTGETSVKGIFAGGDAVTGPYSVVGAIGAGERAAVGIDHFLTGSFHAFWRREHENETAYNPEADPVDYGRDQVRSLDVQRRRHNFDEVEMPWDETTAVRQARRCLRCDYGKHVPEKVGVDDAEAND